MAGFPFECPYCNRPTTAQSEDTSEDEIVPTVFSDDTGRIGYLMSTVVCPNPKCKKTTVTLGQFTHALDQRKVQFELTGDPLRRWNLMPRSRARQYADYVPQAIREDYEEANLILNLSPKSSATLARRTLQGIMRHYFKVKPGNLKREIEEAESTGKMDPTIVDAVHAIRDVGNIGAHMEADIDVIVPVDPGEAEALLQLIELLIEETYVARHDREQRVSAVMKVASDKKALKTAITSSTPPPLKP